MDKLQRNALPKDGFAGIREHRLIKDTRVFGPKANEDGSWSGIGNFVYLANARFIPNGETRMHSHREIDVISVMVNGRINHQGSLSQGQHLNKNDIQVQRAGGEGFSHNEINPDADWNRMIQIWVLPEQSGQSVAYKVYQPKFGNTVRIYGGNPKAENYFPAETKIDVSLLETGQHIEINASFIAYITNGSGTANHEIIKDGDLIRGNHLQFEAIEKSQIIVVYTS